MNVETFFVVTMLLIAAMMYYRYRSLKQQAARISLDGEEKHKASMQISSATNPEQASHNLEYSDQQPLLNDNCPPIRDTLDADFAAEAHGFTGFEKAGKGSRYKSSNH